MRTLSVLAWRSSGQMISTVSSPARVPTTSGQSSKSMPAATGWALPVVVISLAAEREELLRRITGRRICLQGHIYNVYTQPPRVEGVCDVDGSSLEQRKDDTEEVFESRMKVFEAETAPVLPHYRSQGRFAEVNGLQDVDLVTREILAGLARLRGGANSQAGAPRGA